MCMKYWGKSEEITVSITLIATEPHSALSKLYLQRFWLSFNKYIKLLSEYSLKQMIPRSGG